MGLDTARVCLYCAERCMVHRVMEQIECTMRIKGRAEISGGGGGEDTGEGKRDNKVNISDFFSQQPFQFLLFKNGTS